MFPKIEIKNLCLSQINSLLTEYEGTVNELQKGMFEETKSSAGDKYETSRTQFQREIERLKTQISQVNDTKAILLLLSNAPFIAVGEGSLIELNMDGTTQIIYLAAAMGQLKHNGQNIQVISSQSPLGAKLIGKKLGESFEFNQKKCSIISLE